MPGPALAPTLPAAHTRAASRLIAQAQYVCISLIPVISPLAGTRASGGEILIPSPVLASPPSAAAAMRYTTPRGQAGGGGRREHG